MPPFIRKLTGRIGAVVEGVDLTAPPDPSTVTTLRDAIANAAPAYRDLPEPLRALADSLRVVHTNQYDYARPSATTAQRQEYDRIFVSKPYEAEHPVVRAHPLTGERGRITQHYGVDNYDDAPRRLNRVTVAGEVPVGVGGRRSEQLVGDASHYSSVLAVAA